MVRDRFQFIRQTSVVTDFAVIIGSFLVASWLRAYLLTAIFIDKKIPQALYDSLINTLYNADLTLPPQSEIYFDVHLDLLLLFVGIWALCLKAQGAYDKERFVSLKKEYWTISKAAAYATTILVLTGFIFRVGFFPRSLIIGATLLSAGLLMFNKSVIFYGLKWIHQKGYGRKSLLIVGTGNTAEEFVHSVRKHPEWGLDVVGLVGQNRAQVGKSRVGLEVLGTVKDMLEILHQNEIDEVVFAVPVGQLEGLKATLSLCEQEGVQTHIISDFFQTLTAQIQTREIYSIPVLTFSTVPNKEWQFFVKRIFDIMTSSVLLLALSPLFLLISLAIKFTSSGPVLYRWRVVGLNKKRFISYKFRTMVEDADKLKQSLIAHNEMSGPAFKMKQDPRVTPVGRMLRKYSLDELPQLYSVLRGDMSLVGPRPPLVTEIDKFDSWQRRKLSVKPGMTCLWQVRGRNEISDFADWVNMDLEYIDKWSFWLDIKILLKTALVVVRGKGR